MTPYRGPFNSELVLVVGDREIADCVASTGLDLALAAGLRIPNTAAEREALRVDSGDTVGGMSLPSLQAGLRKRYALDARLLSGQANVEAALDAGMAIAGFGRYDSLPVDWRWQKRGDFLHSMWFNRDTSVTRWRADPLAPPSNLGAAMPKTIVRTYLASGGWQALGVFEDSVTNQPSTGGDMADLDLTRYPEDAPRAFTTKPGLKALRRFTRSAELTPIKPPYSGYVDREVVISGTGVPHGSGFLRLSSGGSAGDFIRSPEVDVVAPPDCSAKVSAEHERMRQAAIDAVKALP